MAANFEALGLIWWKQCDMDGISMVEATYRWLLRHSTLGATYDLLVGASSLDQLDQNLQACMAVAEKDSLSPNLLLHLTRHGS
jgi:aflatoxin B1 aldehyde reductase